MPTILISHLIQPYVPIAPSDERVQRYDNIR